MADLDPQPEQTALAALARETGVSLDMLRTLAAISDPANCRLFSADAARKAFARVRPPPVAGDCSIRLR